MLCLYSERNIPHKLLNIKIPWDEYFIKQKVTRFFDETDIKIVEAVRGCKTLLCINHAIKAGNKVVTIYKVTVKISEITGLKLQALAIEDIEKIKKIIGAERIAS